MSPLKFVVSHPPRFGAPMAGLTHSAFRRLVADFGGYGGLWTEMLCARWLRRENPFTSPATRRRPQEGLVVYQLMVGDADDVAPALDRLARVEPEIVDLNLACPAPAAKFTRSGSRLFEDRERLAAILDEARRCHAGPLTVKIRLGAHESDGWRETLVDRLHLFEETGIDAVILHPRFADEKLRGRARHSLYPFVAASTRLPVLASGDIVDAGTLASPGFEAVAGVLVGRRLAERPWLFSHWGAPEPAIDYLEVWRRFCAYALEDFPAGKAFYRIKAFTRSFSGNFFFGHTLDAIAMGADDLETLLDRTVRFLSSNPTLRG